MVHPSPEGARRGAKPRRPGGPGRQVERLARFIVHEVPGEPPRSEGAVDAAIRIMREQQARLDLAAKARAELEALVVDAPTSADVCSAYHLDPGIESYDESAWLETTCDRLDRLHAKVNPPTPRGPPRPMARQDG